jgi:hypothetical protein
MLLAVALLVITSAAAGYGGGGWKLIDARRIDTPTPGWICTYERGMSRFVQFQLSYCSSTPE